MMNPIIYISSILAAFGAGCAAFYDGKQASSFMNDISSHVRSKRLAIQETPKNESVASFGLFNNETFNFDFEKIFNNDTLEAFGELFANALLGKCSLDCVKKMEKFNTTSFSAKSGEDFLDDFDVEELSEFCQDYRPHSLCLKNCSGAELMRNLTLDGLKLLETMCFDNYEDLVVYGACLDKFSNQSEQLCGGKCNKKLLDQVEDLMSFNGSEINDAQLAKINGTLLDACQYLSCSAKCSQPLFEEMCGKPSVPLVKKIFNGLLESVSGTVKLYTLFNPNVTSEWKLPCKPFPEFQ